MNFWDGQQWSPSVAEFELTEDAFVANRVQHRKRLNADLNVIGAVTTTLKGGTTLRSTPVAIALYDPNDGRFAVVSTITNSVGVLVDSNRVVFPEAFSGGVCADVVYTLQKGSFEQDVIITGRLNPLDYGFPTNAQIQVITEFYDPPEPEKIRRPIYIEKDEAVRRRKVSPDLVDEILGFSELVFVTGKAYTPPTATHPNGTRTVVAKEFRTIPSENRTFLIETVNCVPIQKALNALPECVGGARTAQQIRNSKARDGYAFIPRPGSASQAKIEPKRSATLFAQATPLNERGVVIDAIETIDDDINTAKVFQSDTTYFVTDAIYCNGAVTIEGGAVFKYWNSTGNEQFPARTTFLQFNNALTLKTGPYRPAIFTAWDDDSVGDVVQLSTGDPTLFVYASPAIITADYLTLSYCRFSYANVAIQCDAYEGVQSAINHSQFVNCVQGISIIDQSGGCWSGSSIQVTLNNCLMAGVSYPFEFASDSTEFLPNVYLTHCTIANATLLKGPGTGCYAVAVNSYNSIFANVGGWGGTFGGEVSMFGNYNGFYDNGPTGQSTFGGNQTSEQEWPFGPVGYLDGSDAWYFTVNAQAAHYLREGSLFTDAGTSTIPQWLKNDLGRMTTVVPELFNYDVNSSQTLSPTPIADVDTPNLGYHYPVVHYVVCGATVNNCTLNIDQGTVLGFTTPYYLPPGGSEPVPRTEAVKEWYTQDRPRNEWGIRLNPGGRLNVNGVPTNRVVFARLEAVQETPVFPSEQGDWCPVITFKGILTPNGTIVEPLVEARIRSADFPTLASPSFHVGDLQPDYTSDLVRTFELDGCFFANGRIAYETGGLPGRTFTIRNSIFERSILYCDDWVTHGTEEETLIAHNNLFYYCYMALFPVSGNNWMFTDNIFDHVLFDPSNGNVGVNHHNAYVGMNGSRLSPPAPTTTDPDLASLTYQTGPLGRFYLPFHPLLNDKGSQLAKDAGMFHFTSYTSNAKEGTGQVNIGPHYLALVSGRPADGDADGIADFIEDRNGDGIAQATESNWTAANTGNLTILSPIESSTVSGVLKVQVDLGSLGPGAPQPHTLFAKVDGRLVHHSTYVMTPGESLSEVEIDTRHLANGEHTISVTAFVQTASPGPNGASGQEIADSPEIVVNVVNDVRFPAWEDMSQVAFKVNVETPNVTQDYTVWFFAASYPTSYNPTPINTAEGVTSGNISVTETLANLGYGDGSTDPSLYSVSELAVQNTARINPVTRNDPPFPDVGRWVVTYELDPVDATYQEVGTSGFSLISNILDPLNDFDARWMHDIQFGAWTACGVLSGAPNSPLIAYPQPGGSAPQTWPVRYADSRGYGDRRLVQSFVDRPDVRNLYALAHGPSRKHGWLPLGLSNVKHRYRFVFFDGCESATEFVMKGFGASKWELTTPLSPIHRTLGHLVDEGFPGNTGPIPISYYGNYLRPSVFLGWNVKWPIALDLTEFYNKTKPQIDPWTGSSCDYQIYCAVANWHSQVVFFWTQNNKTIVEALRDATDLAYVPGTGSGDLKVFPHIYVGPTVRIGPDRPEYYFDGPRQNLAIYGHGGLKFNAWNHASDFPP